MSCTEYGVAPSKAFVLKDTGAALGLNTGSMRMRYPPSWMKNEPQDNVPCAIQSAEVDTLRWDRDRRCWINLFGDEGTDERGDEAAVIAQDRSRYQVVERAVGIVRRSQDTFHGLAFGKGTELFLLEERPGPAGGASADHCGRGQAFKECFSVHGNSQVWHFNTRI